MLQLIVMLALSFVSEQVRLSSEANKWRATHACMHAANKWRATHACMHAARAHTHLSVSLMGIVNWALF